MRKVTNDSVMYFNLCSNDPSISRRKKFGNNTEVIPSEGAVAYFLHGNLIACYFRDENRLHISSAGWRTATTKERLNGILYPYDVRIVQRMGQWYINNEGFFIEWDARSISLDSIRERTEYQKQAYKL